jgi:hypothetical protein
MFLVIPGRSQNAYQEEDRMEQIQRDGDVNQEEIHAYWCMENPVLAHVMEMHFQQMMSAMQQNFPRETEDQSMCLYQMHLMLEQDWCSISGR